MKRGRASVRGSRRTPEEARTDLLDAAERVFARSMPDEVGLKEIAQEAGVSHALVTHYFGTYAALVEATLERRAAAARGRILERLVTAGFSPGRETALLEVLTDLVRDRLTMRLITWAVLSGRAHADNFFPTRARGLALVVDGMEARLRASGDADVPRRRLEFAVMAAFAMAVGFATAGPAMHRALGHEGEPDQDELLADMHAMLKAYVTGSPRGATEGPTTEPGGAGSDGERSS